MSAHKVTIEIEVPEEHPAGGPVTWGAVRESIRWNTPAYDNLPVGLLSGDINAQGAAGRISVTVRELHG